MIDEIFYIIFLSSLDETKRTCLKMFFKFYFMLKSNFITSAILVWKIIIQAIHLYLLTNTSHAPILLIIMWPETSQIALIISPKI